MKKVLLLIMFIVSCVTIHAQKLDSHDYYDGHVTATMYDIDKYTITYAYGKERNNLMWGEQSLKIVINDSIIITIDGKYHIPVKYRVTSKPNETAWNCSTVIKNEKGQPLDIKVVMVDDYLDWTEKGFTYRYHISNMKAVYFDKETLVPIIK